MSTTKDEPNENDKTPLSSTHVPTQRLDVLRELSARHSLRARSTLKNKRDRRWCDSGCASVGRALAHVPRIASAPGPNAANCVRPSDGWHMRILVIADELKVAQAIEKELIQEQYEVRVALTGEDGFAILNAERLDLVLLDLMLPDRDGLEILSGIRKHGSDIAVLVLTACDAVEERVKGLDAGADDYLVKPFAFSELLARIRALLRRGHSAQVMRLKVADLEMDLVTRRVTRADAEIQLTVREFALLECLLRRKGEPASRETLAQEVWGASARATPLDNVIDVHMARLRRKVDDGHSIKLLQTVRGVGFAVRAEGL